MKKWIIPVCLAYMMLFSTCKRDTGGDHGSISSKREEKTEKIVGTGSKKTVKIRRNAAVDSVLSDADKERKPGGLLDKPRVDVPDVK